MKIFGDLTNYISSFFSEYLRKQKNVSIHTMASYRDSFRLLIVYIAKHLKKMPEQLMLSDLNVTLIRQFLNDLEENRKISVKTRNIRLSAIRSFFRYLSYLVPESGVSLSQILAIPNKKSAKKLVPFFTDQEIKALLEAPNQTTWIGCRDHALIALAIQTGLRLAELTKLKWENVHLSSPAHITCEGKGRKERITPLTKQLVKIISLWKKRNFGSEVSFSDFVFPTIQGGELSSDAFQYLLKKYGKIANKTCPSMEKKQISPHVLRHTAAMRMLHCGVDLTMIAMYLGHESVETTQMYLEATLEKKEKALNKMKGIKTKTKRFHADDQLLRKLGNLTNLSF